MPVAKKEVKPEEPLFVDEMGSYVHEAEQAKYKGGVRRYTQADGGGSPPNPRSNSPSSSLKAAGGSPSSMLSGTLRNGSAAAAALSGSQSTAAPGSNSVAAGAGGPLLYRHGRGTYTCPYFIYEGDWEEDEMHGMGQLTFAASGNTYTGAFSHGCFSGQGVYRWRDGSVYEGQWRANRMHGAGVYTDAQGHIWKGKYFSGTGPGLVRLYPTLERVDGVAAVEATAAVTTAGGATDGRVVSISV
ncbi:hypothetical protein ABB37_08074 [Leptomonas pyrrhocoris]|uniref:MORN repeat-containing protein 5 n=1 Tax=Leptomonas pyrrhocoris TaxID=157538 RepID=A0A0M9FTY1_LEPPY|nr:hypothetical protein ABB37_08074 [Leptomonas pyrrhocoris]XP_015654335.1 hypothetical protein ABB37_08074 [Leptomonas pyrrhocoris]XP_015654336.1 hypothetical protein ABB37_08074 [Leptomonas pyrrhocoris]KPA75895.1 hypothetical protein ABB37_08074 [Leptomonas pyrrhocoris]KPA75896.1 hypothetical protein ABB37_08074 [Leptomonas pyrrhocoris]KPA75897.1 hypothetical protein ABB37_08074 [Leptomonas pyrrhocoris]|eukprot:XP_015654334.1 hypothetical protein ABB37_08074 [Leptomonas pyrrhocoris]